MCYKIFQIELEALSPISITKREFGILYQTYDFIPAWTMWNALVKLYAIKNANDGKINYETAKDDFKKVRLTNFYIFEDNYPKKEIQDIERRKYISSDMKNAINPLTNTSLEGALYEREYIKAKNFVGWVKTHNQNICKFLKEQKNQIFFIGADKNTGLGKIKINQVKEFSIQDTSNNNINDIIKQLINSDYHNEKYLIPPEITEYSHIYPLVLRQWGEKGSGMDLKYIMCI